MAPGVVVVDAAAGTAGMIHQGSRSLDVNVDAADRVDEILRRIDAQQHVAVEPGDARETRR